MDQVRVVFTYRLLRMIWLPGTWIRRRFDWITTVRETGHEVGYRASIIDGGEITLEK